MNSTNEQVVRPHSAQTRQRLLTAGAELIAELGWGRVSTRAIAKRSGLPLGAVSYHFRGKQDLLTEAALHTVERLFPMDEFTSLRTLDELLSLIASWTSDQESLDSVGTGVLMEAMREAARDAVVRKRLAALLADYRSVLAELVRAEQHRGVVDRSLQPARLATLIAAASDGMLLHLLLDSDVDTTGGLRALASLLRQPDHAQTGRRL